MPARIAVAAAMRHGLRSRDPVGLESWAPACAIDMQAASTARSRG